MTQQRSTPKPPRVLGALLAAALLVPAAAMANQFPSQSLIIPMNSSFQDPCGIVSAYGLVYTVLRADEGWRDPKGKGNKAKYPNNWTPITVHWVINSTNKGSPNRCVPTNQDKVYTGGSITSYTQADATWNDGCDIKLVDASGVPATLINNANTGSSHDSSSWATFNTQGMLDANSNYVGRSLAYPNYAATTVKFNGTTSTNVTQIYYSGGPFVISAADAAEFLALLDGTTTGYDVDGNAIDFSPYRTTGSGGPTGTGCTFVKNGDDRAVFGTNTGVGGNTNASANVHYVRIHRAQTSFTADDKNPMNRAPLKIGLIQTVDHDFADEGGTAVIAVDASGNRLNRDGPAPVSLPSWTTCTTNANCSGTTPYCDTTKGLCSDAPCTTNSNCTAYAGTPVCDTFRGVCATACTSGNAATKCTGAKTVCDTGTAGGVCVNPIAGTPTGIKGSQLPYYLASAALTYNGAGGCPSDGYNAGFSGWATGNNMCPNGGNSGQIYDNLDIRDVASGLINQNYAASSSDPPSGPPPRYQVVWAPHWEGLPWRTSTSTTGCDGTCVANALNNFGTFFNTQDSVNTRGFLGECATIGTLEGAVNVGEATTYTGTCNPGWTGHPSATNGGCYPNERYVIPTLGSQSLTCRQGSPTTTCLASPTSPTVGLGHDVSGTVSLHMGNYNDPVQDGSGYFVKYGSTSSPFSQIGDYRWWAYSGGVANYYPLSNTLYQPGAYSRLVSTVNSSGTIVADNVTLIQRANDANRAKVVYLSGHNYTADVAGTRIALNTVLSLGMVKDTTESAFIGPTLFQTSAFVPTYDRYVSAQGIPTSWQVYDPTAAKQWLFPFQTGHLRVHNLATLSGSTGANSYTASSLSYSASIPPPDQRNIFTYLGGKVVADDTALGTAGANSYKSGVGIGVLQLGWQPVAIDQTALNSSSCVDVYKVGAVSKNSGALTYPGMVLGSNGICDLQEALSLSLVTADFGSDNGASNAEQTAIKAKFNSTSEQNSATWVLQRVRGYCFATNPSSNGPYSPATTDSSKCDVTGAVNGANLGALVRSQAAVVPASALISDSPSNAHRPTVAYVGGYDGQLHAFYVPRSDSADSGYTGPASSLSWLNPDATSTFFTSYSGGFNPPASGTELWSFIPPGQLALLKSNNARVDSAPAVADVFGDFNGSGVRTWHTVLVASAGDANREIFALDITNPLAPVMLWDIESSYDTTALAYAPMPLQDDDTGKFTGTSGSGSSARAQAFNWQNRCRAADATAGTCRPASYVLPPTDDNCDTANPHVACGRMVSGLYNYSHLGASQSVSVGTLRRNNAPVFSAFVATNEPYIALPAPPKGGNGIYVFAIDLVTGSKLWEWNNPYDRTTYQTTDPDKYAGTGNTAPAGVSIVSRSLDDQVNSLYVGDDEGSLWELDAADGINNTGYTVGMGSACASPPCNYPLSQAYGDGKHSAQPISTLSTLFVVRPDISTTGLFANYIGQVLLTYGTAGTDAAASIATPQSPSTVTQVSGAIHMLPVSPALRDTALDLKNETGSTKKTHGTTWGVAYELGASKSNSSATAFFPQYLTGGNRVYGSVVADLVTGKLYFGTTTGTVTDINNRGSLSGSLYQIDTTANSSTTGGGLSTVQTGTGGIAGTLGMSYDATTGQVTLIASTDQNIFVKAPTTGGLAASATRSVYKLDGTDTGAQGLLGWIFRRTGREY